MDAVTASRNLVRAIGDFSGAYRDDTRLRDVLAQLRETETTLETLVPAAREDAEESPGRRAAREASESTAKADENAPAVKDAPAAREQPAA